MGPNLGHTAIHRCATPGCRQRPERCSRPPPLGSPGDLQQHHQTTLAAASSLLRRSPSSLPCAAAFPARSTTGATLDVARRSPRCQASLATAYLHRHRGGCRPARPSARRVRESPPPPAPRELYPVALADDDRVGEGWRRRESAC
jgi:hypothetical protein